MDTNKKYITKLTVNEECVIEINLHKPLRFCWTHLPRAIFSSSPCACPDARDGWVFCMRSEFPLATPVWKAKKMFETPEGKTRSLRRSQSSNQSNEKDLRLGWDWVGHKNRPERWSENRRHPERRHYRPICNLRQRESWMTSRRGWNSSPTLSDQRVWMPVQSQTNITAKQNWNFVRPIKKKYSRNLLICKNNQVIHSSVSNSEVKIWKRSKK